MTSTQNTPAGSSSAPVLDAETLAFAEQISDQVASFLLEMADRLGNGAAGAQTSLLLPVSRQQIADVLGLTIETVSRQLTRLRSAGAIELPSRREIILRDRADLELRAG